MGAFSSFVLAWGHRVLTVAVQMGSRLAGSVTDEEQPRDAAAPVVSSGAPQPRMAQVQGKGSVHDHRTATASVTPAMVRRWAHEQGIRIADRGRIPQSVMERYLAEVGGATVSRRADSASKAPHPPSGRSRTSAA